MKKENKNQEKYNLKKKKSVWEGVRIHACRVGREGEGKLGGVSGRVENVGGWH